jgi:predicted nucleotidyltransferase
MPIRKRSAISDGKQKWFRRTLPEHVQRKDLNNHDLRYHYESRDGQKYEWGLDMSINIALDKEKIAEFCEKWKITEFALFGSVLRDDFRPDSDVDVLVTFAPDTHWSLFDLVEMEDELEAIFGREVDLVGRRGIERSSNWIRRGEILSTAEPYYVAR